MREKGGRETLEGSGRKKQNKTKLLAALLIGHKRFT